MKHLYRDKKKYISFLAIFVLLVQIFSPFPKTFVFATDGSEDTGGLGINQSISIVGDKTTVEPEDIVTVRLSYSVSSGTDYFHNVILKYTLPHGAEYIGSTRTGHVLNDDSDDDDGDGDQIYNSNTRTLTYRIGDKNPDDPTICTTGKSAYVDITFKFPSPSVYPNGKTIDLAPAEFSGNFNAPDGVLKVAYSGASSLDFSLADSWVITKDGPATATISQSPTQTELYVDYTISLKDGNIDLKDVEIVDTLPQNASFVSSTIPYSQDGSTITWNLADVPAGETTSIGIRLKFPVFRNIGDIGVKGGDSRTNLVTVTGYPIEMNSDGDIVKSSEEINFTESSDSITTDFVQSTATWGVETNADFDVMLTKDPQVSTVDVAYDIGFIDGDINLKNVDLIYQLPDDATLKSADIDPTSQVDSAFTWHFDDVVVGSSPTVQIVVEYDIDRTVEHTGNGVYHNEQRSNTVSATGFPIKIVDGSEVADDTQIIFDPANDSVTTTFIESDEVWYVEKSGPANIEIPNDDSTTIDATYTLRMRTTGTGDYNIPLKEVTLVDTLPAYATIEPSPDYSVSGSEITWVLADIYPKTPPTIEYTVTYSIDRNGDGEKTGIEIGDTLTNNVSVTEAFPIDEKGDKSGGQLVFEPNNDSDSVSSTFLSPDVPGPVLNLEIYDYNKSTEDKNFDINDQVIYLIDFDNITHNGHTLYDVVLTDETLSDMIDFTEIDLGQSSKSVNFSFEYKTTKDPSETGWRSYGGTYNTTNSNIISISSLNLEKDERITGIRLTYATIPKSFQFSNDIKLIGSVNSAAADDAYILNSAELKYKHKDFDGNSDEITLSDNVQFKVLIDTAWISDLDKTKLTNSEEHSHYTLETLRFELLATNHERLGTANLINPVLIDVVPEGFEYISNDGNDVWETNWNSLNPGITKPNFVKIDNYPNIGQTTLKWYWDDTNSYNLPPGKSIKIQYDLKIKSYAGVGEHYNNFYMLSEGKYKADADIKILVDGNDLDNDSDTAENYLEGDPAKIIVLETAAVNSYKWVKGELDDYYDVDEIEENNYNRYPDNARTTPGGSADYRLQVFNPGNVYIQEIEIVDILPYIGDTEVLNPIKGRGTQWRPYLIQALSQGNLEIVEDIYNDMSYADVKVYYSTASDPIRKKGTGEIGTQDPKWSLTPPKDITSVRSLKFNINNFTDGKESGLNPGGTVTLEWKMRSPVGSPTDGEIAWNSISMMGTVIDSSGDPVVLPPNEPNMVGIQVESNPLGEIGDFVWFDKNHDSEQNDGYDDQLAGINGVTVNLYKYDTGETKWKSFDTTLTGDDIVGNPGYYLFSALETGKYYVTFDIPSYYTITDNKADSVGYEKDGVIRTPEIQIDTESEANRKIHNVDLGLKQSGLVPSMILDKKAVGYKKRDGTEVLFDGTEILFDEDNNCEKQAVNKDETILYKIGIKNNGSVPLHNIKLEDIMTNNGFEFTKTVFIDIDSTRIVFDSIDKDPNIISTEGINNILTLNKLDIGEEYEFDAEYKVLEADINRNLGEDTLPIKNTLKIWVNELKDKENPETPYKEVDETVEIADLRLEKTVSAIKKKDTDSFVTVSSQLDLGVEAGDIIKYKIVAYNDGTVDLNDVVVNDVMLGLIDYNIPFIGKGDNVVVEGEETEYIVIGTESDPFTNTVTTTQDEVRYEVEDEFDVNFKGLAITKTITQINGETPTIENGKLKDGEFLANVGDEIEYIVTLTNVDDAILKNVTITKDVLTSSQGIQNKLSSVINDNPAIKDLINNGDSKTFRLIYNVSEDDIASSNTQPIQNQVWGKSTYTSQKRAYCDLQLANLEVTKEADKTTFRTGEDIIYTIKVKNNGTVPLHNVKVTDLMLGIDGNIKGNIGDIAVDEEKILTGTYKATKEDYTQGKIENIVKAVSDETPIKESKVIIKKYVPHTPDKPKPEPSISLSKTGDKSSAKVGDVITYSISVTNVGNVPLTNVVVSDSMLAINKSIESLDISETKTFSGAYTVTDADEKDGKVVNIATANSKETEQKQDKWTVYITKEKASDEEKEEVIEEVIEKDLVKEKEKEVDDTTKIIPKDKVEPKEIVEEPEHGTVVIDKEGNIIYTPNEGYKGKDKFKVKVITEDGEEVIMEIEIEDDEVAKGGFELPKTGQKFPSPYYPLGFSMIAIGLYLTIKKKK